MTRIAFGLVAALTVTAPTAGTLALAAVCAVTDLRSLRIPNWATCGVLAGTALRAAGGLADPAEVLAGAMAAGLPLLAVYAARGCGAGDVKLAAALGGTLGPAAGLECLVLGLALGGAPLLAAAVLAGPRQGPLRERLRRPVPLGACLALGVAVQLAREVVLHVN